MWSNDRRSANNDGMDPDWRPTPSKPSKSEPLEKLREFILAVEPIIESARQVPYPVTENGGTKFFSYKIVATQSIWNRIVEAYDAVQFKSDEKPTSETTKE